MGTYNGAPFLREQLNSLAQQVVQPIELVICDDTSTDATGSIVHEFARSAPFPVHFEVNSTRLGFADNFLKAARLCRGELIAFCDQDDVWYPEKLARCGEALIAPKTVLCAHDADLGDSKGNISGYHSAGVAAGCYTALSLNPWGSFFGFTIVFRREILDIIDPISRPRDDRDLAKPMSHDNWLYFLGNCFGDTVYLARPLAMYRQHGANLYGSSDLTMAQKVRKLVVEYEQYLHKYRCLAESRVQSLASAHPLPHFADRTINAHRFWTRIETLYARRLELASVSSRRSRVFKIASLWREGTYAPLSKGGIGRRGLAEDITAALAGSK